MRTFVLATVLGALALVPSSAVAQQTTGTEAPPIASAPPPSQTSAPTTPVVAPPEARRTRVLPTGQWVLTDEYGWIWVPNGASSTSVEGVPYTYLYTPSFGWTWYVSPWGIGPYHYGVWVVHPWRPIGWRGGWVAGPRVVMHLHPVVHPVHVMHVGRGHVVFRGHRR